MKDAIIIATCFLAVIIFTIGMLIWLSIYNPANISKEGKVLFDMQGNSYLVRHNFGDTYRIYKLSY